MVLFYVSAGTHKMSHKINLPGDSQKDDWAWVKVFKKCVITRDSRKIGHMGYAIIRTGVF